MIIVYVLMVVFAVPIIANIYMDYQCRKGIHKTFDFEGKTICRYCSKHVK